MIESDPNPYQSPAASIDDHPATSHIQGQSPADYKLYSVGSVVLATFLGSPVAGGAVMAINYKRVGRSIAALHAVVWTALVTTAIIAVAIILPDDVNIPNAVFFLPQIIAMYYFAKSLQGPVVEAHERLGGSLASAWGAAGIGVLSGTVLLGAAVAVAMLLPE